MLGNMVEGTSLYIGLKTHAYFLFRYRSDSRSNDGVANLKHICMLIISGLGYATFEAGLPAGFFPMSRHHTDHYLF